MSEIPSLRHRGDDKIFGLRRPSNHAKAGRERGNSGEM
jgi:hypothetical protein